MIGSGRPAPRVLTSLALYYRALDWSTSARLSTSTTFQTGSAYSGSSHDTQMLFLNSSLLLISNREERRFWKRGWFEREIRKSYSYSNLKLSLDWSTNTRLSRSSTFEFQTSHLPRALDFPFCLSVEVEALASIFLCYVMILGIYSRFEKSYSYSISYSYSNLKLSIVQGAYYTGYL